MVGLSLLNRKFSDCRIMIIHYCIFDVELKILETWAFTVSDELLLLDFVFEGASDSRTPREHYQCGLCG